RASATTSGSVSTPPQPAARTATGEMGGHDSSQHTPLPAPAPGMDSGADEFSKESTRVMQDAIVQKLAAESRGHDAAEEFTGDPTRKAAAEQMDELRHPATPSAQMKAVSGATVTPIKPAPAPEPEPEPKTIPLPTRPVVVEEPKVEAKPAAQKFDSKKDLPKP